MHVNGPASSLPGLFIGVVVDDQDPEHRFRVRVNVSGVNTPDTPTEVIPWAEVMFQGAVPMIGGTGDYRAYRRGQWVFVQFLSNHPLQPVVIGGCTAPVASVPPVPLELVSDGEKAKKRWVRRDRNGNAVELSENSDENHVKLTSGEHEIVVSRSKNGIKIRSIRGNVSVEGADVVVSASTARIKATDITIDASGANPSGDEGKATVQAIRKIDIVADNPTPSGDVLGETEINIGGKFDEYKGVRNPPPTGHTPRQTDVVRVQSKNINLGVGTGTEPDIDEMAGTPLPPTLNITLRCIKSVAIKAPVSIDVETTGTINAKGTFVNLQAMATARLEALGAVSVSSVGPLLLMSVSTVSIQGTALNFSSVPGVPPIFTPPKP